MALQIDWNLFLSTFVLIFLAELPDKTTFAILLMATRRQPWAVFIGVAIAFIIQSAVAVVFGSFLNSLPHKWVSVGTATLFFIFAFLMWRKDDSEDEKVHLDKKKVSFAASVWSCFLIIFIAEWGDLTQLASAALTAEHQKPLTIFLASTLALWTVTAIAILVGNKAKKLINPVVLHKVAAVAFVVVGIVLLVQAF
jgi:putative Ca2+/H+ antiporter (TMEM165/GDT1 family)